MDLRQLKRIKNIQKFNTGKIGFQPTKPDASFDPIGTNYSLLDQKVYGINLTQNGNLIKQLNKPNTNGLSNYKQPIYEPESSENKPIGNISSYIQPAISLANGINTSINLGRKSSDQILAESSKSNNSIMGQNYVTQNVDENAQMDQVKQESTANALNLAGTGATIGSTFGPIGTGVGAVVGAIGGLFAGGAAKRRMRRKIEEARRKAFRINTFNRASAMSNALDQQYNLDYSNTQDDILYANRGKDLKPLKRKKRC